MKRQFAARLAAAGVVLTCHVWPYAASAADDGALVWAPSKAGTNAYRLRVGVRARGAWERSVGADLALRATPGGKIDRPDGPVRLWGLLSRKRSRQAATNTAVISLNFNTMNGAGSVDFGSARSWIVTPHLDAELSRNLVLQCNAYENRCRGPRLTHSARLTAPATRTAIVAQGQLSSDDRTGALKRIGIEQRFGALHLGAAIAEPTRAARGVFDLRYSFSW